MRVGDRTNRERDDGRIRDRGMRVLRQCERKIVEQSPQPIFNPCLQGLVCIRMKNTNRKLRIARIFLFIVGFLLVVGIVGYFVGQTIVKKRVSRALDGLPEPFSVSYSEVDPGLLTGSLIIKDLKIRCQPGPDSFHRHEVMIDRLAIHGISYFDLLMHHRLHIGTIRLEGCQADLDDWLLDKKIPLPKMQGQPPFTEAVVERFELADMKATAHKMEKGEDKEGHQRKGVETLFFEGNMEVDSIHLTDINQPIDTANVHFGRVRLVAKEAHYLVPDAFEKVRLKNAVLDSRKETLSIDTARIAPTVSQEEIGRIKNTQVDCVEGVSEGIEITGLQFKDLLRNRLVAQKISIRRNNLHVFRDRRLPRDESEKPLPMDYLRSLAVTIRVRSVKFGNTTFAYEEFPKKWDKPGVLRIVGLSGTLTPLINHPVEGDPAYLTMVSEGSLMGSGTVTATTKMPLHKGDPYKVEGAFHNLDVTALNNSAENLGRIHLESGLLDMLAFQFDMTAEKSTGKIVGEYHNLVVQKLKENTNDIKVDKMKSFALKKFIIPLNKDKSLPEDKRTGKVDYKRDPSRYFSFYLLHSLLVGVKKSFTLGFLLPG